MPDNKKNPNPNADKQQQQKKQDLPNRDQQSSQQPGKDRDKGDKIEEQGGGRQVGNDNDLENEDEDQDQAVTQRNQRVSDDSMKDVE